MPETSRCAQTSGAGKEDPVNTRRAGHAKELSEDIEVAIEEFLERQPDAGRQEILQAIRLTRKGRAGRRLRTFFVLAVTLIAAIVLGFVLSQRGRGSPLDAPGSSVRPAYQPTELNVQAVPERNTKEDES